MKKVWVIILGLIIVLAVISLWFLLKSRNGQYLETIRYQEREYHLGSAKDLTLAKVEKDFKVEIVSSNSFYDGREIYVSAIQPAIYPYFPTLIFLKHKNIGLFDIYALQGGP